MAFWGAGAAGGWSGGGPGGPGGPQRLRRAVDNWDDEEYGSVFSQRVMRRLLPYLRPFKGRAALALLGMAAYAAALPFQPLLIGMAS